MILESGVLKEEVLEVLRDSRGEKMLGPTVRNGFQHSVSQGKPHRIP